MGKVNPPQLDTLPSSFPPLGVTRPPIPNPETEGIGTGMTNQDMNEDMKEMGDWEESIPPQLATLPSSFPPLGVTRPPNHKPETEGIGTEN